MTLDRDVPCICPCGERTVLRAPLSWILEEAGVQQALATDAFHRFRCARCGASVAVELDFVVTNRARDRLLQVVVASADVAKAREDLVQLAPYAWARIVDGRRALGEKVRLLGAGLDDVAFEIAKFLRRVSLQDQHGRYELRFGYVDPTGLAVGSEPGRAQVVLAVLEHGRRVGVVAVPVGVVERIQREHDTHRFQRELEVDERLARRILNASR